MSKQTYLNFDEECWGPKAEAISIWHFDPKRVDKEEDVFTRICNFNLDFDTDIENAEKLIKPTVTYNNDVWEDLGYNDISNNVQTTEASTKLNLKEFPTFAKIIQHLGLVEHPEYDIKVKVFRQMPGQILPSHIDNYRKPTEQTTAEIALQAVRFAVALNDWNVGHYWHFGNAVWQQWSKGDCVHWHRTMAHGTANVGHTPRLTLQITGIPSEHTLKLINNN